MIFKITEIFYSIQQEGVHCGKPAIFIRFFGCNLTCSFCDEPLHRTYQQNFTQTQLFEEIKKYPSQNIILTGGEPSLYSLNNLIKELQKKGYYICVETNGYKPENIKEANWITLSPKTLDNFENFYDEIKFIVNENTNTQKILECAKHEKKPIYIQPESNLKDVNYKNINFCIKLVKQNPHLRLSIQTHKLIYIK